MKIVTVTAQDATLNELYNLVEKAIANLAEDEKKCISEIKAIRNLDPSVAVAIAGAVGAVVGSLITALTQLIVKSKYRKVILHSSSGAYLDIPLDTSDDDMKRYLSILKEMDIQSLELAIDRE